MFARVDKEMGRTSSLGGTSRARALKSLVLITTVILLLALTTHVMSLILTGKTIANSGSVKTVGFGVYWDAALTNSVSSIDWGTIERGSNNNVTVYIRNEGNSAVTLTISTTNWNPSTASNYITLTSNYSGQSIGMGAVVVVKLTLSVSATAVGITNFAFDTSIVASG